MRKARIARRGAFALCAASAALLVPSASAAPEREDFDFLQASTVRIVSSPPGRGTHSLGTGWVIATADALHNANNAVIVTAAHVVEGVDHVAVMEADRSDVLEASVRARDFNRDIAFLEVRGLRSGGAPLAVTPVVPPVGQELRTTGYALASDQRSRNSVAEISGVLSGAYSRSIPDPRPTWRRATVSVAEFQHSIPIFPGFSGGPVIDKCGRVVGFNVLNGGTVSPGGQPNLAPGISFAVAATEIIKAAEDRGIRLTVDASPCPDANAAPPPQQAANAGDQAQATPATQTSASLLPGRTGMAAIIGAFALIALGIAAWLFFGKSTARRSAVQGDPEREPMRITTVTAGPIVAEPGARTLTLTGRGPAGEPISLRFSSEELQSQPRTIGTESEMLVPDNRAKTFVSRAHAEISWDGEHFCVKDLKSMNGTQLDGQPVAPLETRRLRDGATLTLADVALAVQID